LKRLFLGKGVSEFKNIGTAPLWFYAKRAPRKISYFIWFSLLFLITVILTLSWVHILVMVIFKPVPEYVVSENTLMIKSPMLDRLDNFLLPDRYVYPLQNLIKIAKANPGKPKKITKQLRPRLSLPYLCAGYYEYPKLGNCFYSN